MKKGFLLSLLIVFSSALYSQKVNISILRTTGAASSEWQILDENYQQVMSSRELPDADSVIFPLEAERRYFFQVTLHKILIPGIPVYSLRIDNEHILDAGKEEEEGDYFYPFHTATRQNAAKIIGGTTASISDFPWQIYLIAGAYACGGSIIAPGWVLTAAHCLRGWVPEVVHVTAGSSTHGNDGTVYQVSQLISHPNYNSTTFDNDIALVKIKGTINCTNCKPIKLMNAKNVTEGYIDPGVLTYITGWGLTDIDPQTIPSTLQKAMVPIVSHSTASEIWGTIPASDLMAGYLYGNKDACSGDSGGPMSVLVDGEYKVAGVVSWGSKNCDTYGAYSNVAYFENWIRQNTGIYDYTPPLPSGDAIVCAGTTSTDYTEELFANALDYEWRLVPANAGSISWTWEKATVSWNPGFIGIATVKARVTFPDSVSEWAGKTINCALNTKLISQPGDTEACKGDTLNLILNTEGTNMVYGWYKDGSLFKTTSDSVLSWSGIPESATGTYKCQIKGLCGTLSTADIHLTVYPLTVINGISPDVTADYGTNVTLSVDAGGHNLSYQWLRNGDAVPNSNSSDLLMQNVDARNIGLYRTIVKGTCGTHTSDSAYVYLKESDVSTAPVISVWPTVVNDEFNVAKNDAEKYEIRIVNSSGKLMKDIMNCSYQTTLNIGSYPKGFYIVNIKGNKFTRSFKIIKE
jgi:hypothetical protein